MSFGQKHGLSVKHGLLVKLRICTLFDETTEYSKRYISSKVTVFMSFQLLLVKSAEMTVLLKSAEMAIIVCQFHLDCNTLQNANSFRFDTFLSLFDTF